MTGTPDDGRLVDDILSLADRIFRVLLPSVPREVLSLDITMRQLEILLLLHVQGTMRVSDIATSLETSLPAASNLIDRLVERGYVHREGCSEDRRVVFCSLSTEGSHTVGRIWESARRQCEALLRTIEGEKLALLAESLGAMYDAALAANPSPEWLQQGSLSK